MNSILQEAQQRREREEQQRLRKLQDDADFQAVLDLPQGRRFVRRVLGECGVYQCSFNSDAAAMSFNEGRRSLALWLLALLSEYPDKYIELLKEAKR